MSVARHTAILLAAGSGSRMRGKVADKILAPLNGRPVFLYSAQAFLDAGFFEHFIIVYRDSAQRVQLQDSLAALDLREIRIQWVLGGAERQDSVGNALTAAEGSDYVYIHDCARPLVTPGAIFALKEAVIRDNAAVLAHPVVDTVKRITDQSTLSCAKLEDLDRSRLWSMETPQAFAYSLIANAYAKVQKENRSITDDTAAVATLGAGTTLVPNTSPNLKITTPDNLALAQWLLQSRSETPS